MDTLYSAMEGFLTSIPGSATDDPEFMKVQLLHCSIVYEISSHVIILHQAGTPTTSCHSQSTTWHRPIPLYPMPTRTHHVWEYWHVSWVGSTSTRRSGELWMAWALIMDICIFREKGGAYGGGARTGETTFAFYSYRYVCTSFNSNMLSINMYVVCFNNYHRDPHSLETLDRFQDSINWACQGSFSQEDIDEARLSVFSQVRYSHRTCTISLWRLFFVNHIHIWFTRLSQGCNNHTKTSTIHVNVYQC